MEAEFSGGAITSNEGYFAACGGGPALGSDALGIQSTWGMHGVRPVAEHRLQDLLRQRVYALALGHEDLNDHGELRHDPALQTATSRIEGALASPSTLCRLGAACGSGDGGGGTPGVVRVIREGACDAATFLRRRLPDEFVFRFDSIRQL